MATKRTQKLEECFRCPKTKRWMFRKEYVDGVNVIILDMKEVEREIEELNQSKDLNEEYFFKFSTLNLRMRAIQARMDNHKRKTNQHFEYGKYE